MRSIGLATQAQEAFLEGHVLAFEYFGGLPGRIRRENVPRNIFGLMSPPSLCAGPAVVPSRTPVPQWFDDSSGRRRGA